MEFHPINIDSKSRFDQYLRQTQTSDCNLAFANIFSWQFLYHSALAMVGDFLVIRFYIDGGSNVGYMQPLGEGDFASVIPLLEADSAEIFQPLRLVSLTQQAVEWIDEAYPDQFAFWNNRALDDYIYRTADLSQLTGSAYKPKRNHINKFESLYQYTYRPLTAADAPMCLELAQKWREETHFSTATQSVSAEKNAMERTLAAFDELGIEGGALFVDEKMVAFTYGSPINDSLFCTHVEKADRLYDGAFTVINRDFAQQLESRYERVNREEDMGLEGLRRAKESYHPVVVPPKYTALKLDQRGIECRQLWHDVFGDSRQVIDQFFVNHYSWQSTLTHQAEGHVAAMLHIVRFGDAAYIYAVATAPEHRGKGLASLLIAEAVERCRKFKCRLIALIPSDEYARALYLRHGFEDSRTPVRFLSPDNFDFGTGDEAQDLAMIMRLDAASTTESPLILKK